MMDLEQGTELGTVTLVTYLYAKHIHCYLIE